MSTRYELRQDIAVIRNYGQLLIDVSAVTPDGICCFFTSYSYMEYILNQWDKMKILSKVLQHKLIFIETKVGVCQSLIWAVCCVACCSSRTVEKLSLKASSASCLLSPHVYFRT